MAVVICALKAMPLSEFSTQHREVSKLLLHIRQNLQVLEEGVAMKGVVCEGGLAVVFLPLAEKSCNKMLARGRLFLWALLQICGHVIILTDLSSSK